MGINRVEGLFHVEARIESATTGAHIASVAVHRTESVQSAIQWRAGCERDWAQYGEIGIPAIDSFLHAMRVGNVITFHAGG